MSFGNSAFGKDFYGGVTSLFQVVSARSINTYTVLVTFSGPPDFNNSETLNPANYYIEGDSPGTLIGAPYSVAAAQEENSVLLTTSEQQYVLYEVSVNNLVESLAGTAVDELAKSASFTGFPIPDPDRVYGFKATAIRANAINLVFSQAMVVDFVLTNGLSYTVRSMDGTVVPVLSAIPNLTSDATRVVLNLGANLTSGKAYEVRLSPALNTVSGLSILPDSDLVVWVGRRLSVKVPFSSFSREVQAPVTPGLEFAESLSLQETLSALLVPYRIGPEGSDSLHEAFSLVEDLEIVKNEVETQVARAITVADSFQLFEKLSQTSLPDSRPSAEGSFSDSLSIRESLHILPAEPTQSVSDNIAKLFGNPNGLVFFSPALVDGGSPTSSIQVDEVKTCTQAYDTYTFPETIDPPPLFLHGGGLVATPVLSTLNNTVLFTNFYRLNEAKHNLGWRQQDVLPPSSDIYVSVILTEVWPPDRVSLLNNPAWTLFDGINDASYDFKTADNLSPFPSPVVSDSLKYLNPSETLTLSENLQAWVSSALFVSDTVTMVEVYDLVPGENVVQVNVSETVTRGEAVSTSIGINLFETLTLSEVVNLST